MERNEKRKIKSIIKNDQYGLLYSTELLLSIILLVFIIGTIVNLSDGLNEKMLSEEELSSLENTAIEASDYLLKNPGSPRIGRKMKDWMMTLSNRILFQDLP